MVGNQSKNPAGLALIATDSFVYFGGHQVDYHHLSGSKNVDVSGRMIVWVDYDPQTTDTQDRGNAVILAKPNRSGKNL